MGGGTRLTEAARLLIQEYEKLLARMGGGNTKGGGKF
jgi:molybdenum-dependent DNA-binding transcriptional regulator ModE